MARRFRLNTRGRTTVKTRGGDYRDLERALREVGRVVEREVAAEALGIASELIVGEAQIDSPVETGFLRESHFDEIAPDGRTAEMGASAVYAAAVHERHPTKKHWFVNAIFRSGPAILERSLKAAMERHFPGSTS